MAGLVAASVRSLAGLVAAPVLLLSSDGVLAVLLMVLHGMVAAPLLSAGMFAAPACNSGGSVDSVVEGGAVSSFTLSGAFAMVFFDAVDSRAPV